MFERLPALAPDPILGLMAAYRNDPNEKKVDLGVGVYRDETGATPILDCVKRAAAIHSAHEKSKSYVGPLGDAQFNEQITALILGHEHQTLGAERVATVQAPGGCGALRLGAELIARAKPDAKIWVPDPTWANHVPLLGNAGLTIATYDYYDATSQALRAEAMLTALGEVPAGDLVLLHGCCHNPCGVDLTPQQWGAVADLAVAQGFTPFVDLAYLGLGTGLSADAHGVRELAQRVPELVIASSCSKNFGLYRERVGALSIVASSANERRTVLSQMQNVARGIYSMPPNYGAALVGLILTDSQLTTAWQAELTVMRDRINGLRTDLAGRFRDLTGSQRFDFIAHQQGMFSFLGLSKEQIERLRAEFSVYMVDSSRINVAGLNRSNIDYFCAAVRAII